MVNAPEPVFPNGEHPGKSAAANLESWFPSRDARVRNDVRAFLHQEKIPSSAPPHHPRIIMANKKKYKNRITNFLLEVGALKRLPRMGWLDAGIPNPETIAEHSMRTAIIAWILSDMEKTDSERTVKMALIHDMHETRSGDTTTVTKIYLKNYKEAEARAIVDISRNLPPKTANEYRGLMVEFLRCRTPEAKVARDADKLEQFLQAKEYSDIGYKTVEEWKDVRLFTKSAKKLAKMIKKSRLQDWWGFIR